MIRFALSTVHVAQMCLKAKSVKFNSRAEYNYTVDLKNVDHHKVDWNLS